jgi:hypothetical protein
VATRPAWGELWDPAFAKKAQPLLVPDRIITSDDVLVVRSAMSSFLTSAQHDLTAALVESEPTYDPSGFAVPLIMDRQHCSQDEAFAVLRDLRPYVATVSEVPFLRTKLIESVFPQERWKWVACGGTQRIDGQVIPG